MSTMAQALQRWREAPPAPPRRTLYGYQGAPGGHRDPATPGGYCLARCRCGTCPQYVPQAGAPPPPTGPLADRALGNAAKAYSDRTAHPPPAPDEQVDWSESSPAVEPEPPRPVELWLQRPGWWQTYAAVVKGARTPYQVHESGVPLVRAQEDVMRLVHAGLLRLQMTDTGRQVTAVAQPRGYQGDGVAWHAARKRSGQP